MIMFAMLCSLSAYAGEGSDSNSGMKAVMEIIEKLQQRIGELENRTAKQEKTIQRQKRALEKVAEVIPEIKPVLAAPEKKVLVDKFVIKGPHLLTAEDFHSILKKYRNKQLTLSQIKGIPDEITSLYRSRGYITSLAYVPAQQISNNTVEFRVVEGRVGDIKFEESKYSKNKIMEKKFLVEKGEILDYDKLQKNVKRLNKQPDRTVKAVLLPGSEKGTSNIELQLTEEDPMHFHLSYNNRGTDTTTKSRFGLGFVHNNLFGWDDIFTARVQMGENSDVYAGSLDYNIPFTKYDTRLGFYGGYSHADIGGMFNILSPEGDAYSYGIYLTHPLFDKDFSVPVAYNLSSNITLGLDAVSVKNEILGEETSHDELRVVKAGIGFDEKDSLGRTFMSNEIRFGFDNFLGSMDEHDEKASRAANDASSEFSSYIGSLTRITRLPFGSLLINSFDCQYTGDSLVNSEQMSFGGADTIRGFPENDYLADYGWMSTVEFRTPAFIFPNVFKVPFDKDKNSLKDSMQFVYFFDFGKGYIQNARAGEADNKSFRSAGVGLRMDLYEWFHGSVDWGFPIGNDDPGDASSSTVHVGLQCDF